jgi:hypothetical protein
LTKYISAGVAVLMLSSSAAFAQQQPANAGNATPQTATSSGRGRSKSTFEWISNPPAWVTWLSLGGGLSAFLWHLYEYVTDRRDRDADLRRETDAYWYDAIVIEQILGPLLEFLQTQSVKFDSIGRSSAPAAGPGDPFRQYLDAYQERYAALACKIRLLQVVSKVVYEDLMKRLDDLEDSIAIICYENSRAIEGAQLTRGRSRTISDTLSDAQVDCVSLLRELHARMHAQADG